VGSPGIEPGSGSLQLAIHLAYPDRADGSADESTSEAVEIDRTDTSTHRLILDGMSQTHTNDSSPSPGQGIQRDYVTIRGFRIIAGDDGVGGQIINYWGGSHVVIEENDLSHHANAGHGAGPQFGYAYHQAGTWRSSGTAPQGLR
jgi:hypothetical protein